MTVLRGIGTFLGVCLLVTLALGLWLLPMAALGALVAALGGGTAVVHAAYSWYVIVTGIAIFICVVMG